MRHIAIIFLCGLLTASCGICRCYRDLGQDRTVTIVDSVVFRSEVVSVPLPSENVADVVPAGDTSRVQTSVAEAVAWIEGGRLHQQLRNRSDQLLKITLDVPVYIHSEKEVVTRTKVQEVEKPIGWFRKTLLYAGAAAVAIALVALVVAVIRHKNTLLKLFKHN